jgi:hypothetical protein
MTKDDAVLAFTGCKRLILWLNKTTISPESDKAWTTSSFSWAMVAIKNSLLLVHMVSHPSSDGGLKALCDVFAGSDTTLTKYQWLTCDFGSHRIGNRTVSDLTIRGGCAWCLPFNSNRKICRSCDDSHD